MLNYVQTLQGAAATLPPINVRATRSASTVFRDGPVRDGLFWAIRDVSHATIATDLAPAGWSVSASALVQSTAGGPSYYDAAQHLSVIVPAGAAPGLYYCNAYYSGPVTLLDGSLTATSYLTPISPNPSTASSSYSYGRDYGTLPVQIVYVCSDWTVTSTSSYWNAATNTLTMPYDPRTKIVPTAALTFSLVSPQPPLPPPPYAQGLLTFSSGNGFYDGGTYEGPFTGTGNPPPYNYIFATPNPGPRGLRQGYKILQLLAARDTTGMSLESAGPFSAFYSDRSWGIPASLTLTSETVNISPNVRDYPFPQTNVQRTITVDVYVGNPVATSNPYVVTTQGAIYLLDKFILIHLIIVIPPRNARKVSAGDQMDMAQDHASGLITIVRSIGAA